MHPVEGDDPEEPRALLDARAGCGVRLGHDAAHRRAQDEPDIARPLALTPSRRVELRQMRFGRRDARLGRLRRQARLELTTRRQRADLDQPLDSGTLGPGQLHGIARFGHGQLERRPVLAVPAVRNDLGERLPTSNVRPDRAGGQVARQSARHRRRDVDLAACAGLDLGR